MNDVLELPFWKKKNEIGKQRSKSKKESNRENAKTEEKNLGKIDSKATLESKIPSSRRFEIPFFTKSHIEMMMMMMTMMMTTMRMMTTMMMMTTMTKTMKPDEKGRKDDKTEKMEQVKTIYMN